MLFTNPWWLKLTNAIDRLGDSHLHTMCTLIYKWRRIVASLIKNTSQRKWKSPLCYLFSPFFPPTLFFWNFYLTDMRFLYSFFCNQCFNLWFKPSVLGHLLDFWQNLLLNFTYSLNLFLCVWYWGWSRVLHTVLPLGCILTSTGCLTLS